MLAHPVPSCWEFCRYGMPVTVAALTPGVGLSPVLGSIDFPLVEIGGLRVDSPFIHVKLINFNRVPVVEIASGVVKSRLVGCSVVVGRHSINVVGRMTNCRSGLEIRTRTLNVIQWRVKIYVIIGVVQLLRCLLKPEIGASLKLFPQHLVFSCKFINL